VLAAAACLSVVTGVLCGIVPALQLSRPNLTNSLKDGIHGASAGRGRRRLRGLLVVAEVALAVVLLVGAGLFIGSFMALMRVDPGFNPDRVLTVDIISRVEPGQPPPDRSAAFGEIAERLGKVPGVVHASMSRGGVPFAMRLWINNLRVPGRTIERDPGVSIKVVTPDYHKAMGIPLRRGRLFDATDYAGGQNAVIINDSAAKTYFPGEDPVGRTVSLNGADRTVVGVVGDVRQRSLEAATLLEVYLPMSQTESSYGEVLVRTSVDPYDVLPAVKSVVLATLPDVPLRSVKTMEELVFRETAQRRLNMLMLGLFGLLGLVISSVGIYGVMA
jgi:putative ABC transport system permease protein